MSDEDIADPIVAWAHAAGDAKALGYDTLEIHGARGNLVDQFFWDGTDRCDGGGGTEIGRGADDLVEPAAGIFSVNGRSSPAALPATLAQRPPRLCAAVYRKESRHADHDHH